MNFVRPDDEVLDFEDGKERYVFTTCSAMILYAAFFCSSVLALRRS